MLTVAKVTSRDAVGYADYLAGKTAASSLGDYYLKNGERVEAPGRWVAGAELAGGDQRVAVTDAQLQALMSVRHPATGEALRPLGGSGQAVAALDATFSAPKSVSAVWALADVELRAAVEAAHERAVDRAVRYSISEVAMIRQRIDRERVVHAKAVDLVATSWRHSTARAVGGRPPDPQLHSHVLLHAAVRGDGKLVAIDSRSWLLHRRELGAAYRTELAHELGTMGFDVERGTGRGGRYFEIAGVPQQLLDQWSSRHHQVQTAIQQRLAAKRNGGEAGRLSAAEERLAALGSRAAKQPVTIRDLDREWRQAARESGFEQIAVRGLRDAHQPMPEAATVPELVTALTEFDATFTDRQARAVALERSAGTSIEEAIGVLDQAHADGRVLALADGRRTTDRQRASERAVINSAARLTPARHPAMSFDASVKAVEDVGRRLAEHDAELSHEQLKALTLATSSRQVVMIEGQAGTGKSTVLQAVALAHQTDGRDVIVTSTAALAAQRLAADLADVGVDAPAYSTVALQRAIRDEQLELGPRSTVIHDEAAISSTREQRQLLEAVEDSGARLVIVGDPKQSKPVGAGGLWPHLERLTVDAGAHVELTHNLRAQDPGDRRDQQLFRDGEHLQAVHGYHNRNRVHIGPDQQAAEHNALTAAHNDQRNGRKTLVIAQTSNDHLDELNAYAQAIRLRASELGYASLPIPGRPYLLRPGDEIQIRSTINHPERQLRNGTAATITHIDMEAETATVRLADHTELQLDREQLDRAGVRLAYVQHPLPAQGATVDTGHLILTEHTTREGAYVALTRSRQASHIHAAWDKLTADPEQQPLARAADLLSRTEPEVPSIASPLAHEQHIERETASERDDQAFEADHHRLPDIAAAAAEPADAQLLSRRTGTALASIPVVHADRSAEAARLTRDEDMGWEM